MGRTSGLRLNDCNNVADFRKLAMRRLPGPIFHYIDGAADDEVTCRRNSASFDDCDLVPDVLVGSTVDTSTTIMGRKTDLPLMLSPTAVQRLFHWQGERAVAAVASAHNLWFGISSLATVSIEEIGRISRAPKLFQLYAHKDHGLNRALFERCRAAGFDAVALTVDTSVSGNRECCRRTGFTLPPKLTARSLMSFARHPGWVANYLGREAFALPNLAGHLRKGVDFRFSVAEYFNHMLDPALDWKKAETLRAEWGGAFCLKGIMSVADAKRAIDIGATAIMVSNHGGRQLDGSRAPFDQLPEIVDAVGGQIEIICDGGIRRGSHVLKALSAGANACSGGRLYLYALAAGGEKGVRRIIDALRDEITRDLQLMGKPNIAALSRENLRWR